MLVLKKEMDLYDFENEFRDELKDLPYRATEIIYDSLWGVMAEGEYTVMDVRDYLRFQMQVMSVGDVVDAYGYGMDGLDLEDLEDDATIEAIETYLNYNTYLLGTFEDDGITYFIFDEF